MGAVAIASLSDGCGDASGVPLTPEPESARHRLIRPLRISRPFLVHYPFAQDQPGVALLPSKGTSETRAEDAALAERLRAADTTAYEELYRRYGSRLYGLAYRMMGRAADAEDMLQEIFLQVFRRVDTFKGDSALGTWLYRLAMNLCLDRLRSRAGRTERLTSSVEDLREWRLPGRGAIDGHAVRIDMDRAIARLPEACRAAFLLHDVEGFEHQEVGRILGVSDGTSKSQVHKARLRIRAFLLGGDTRSPGPPGSGQR